MIFQKKDQFIVFGNIKFNGYVQLNVMYIVPSPPALKPPLTVNN